MTITSGPDLPGTAELTGRVIGAEARIPPNDVAAERAVLGCILIAPDAIGVIREQLQPEDFYAERHGHLYRAAVALADRGEPIDIVTLQDQLERGPGVGRAGGLDYVAELSLAVPTAASVKHYADIVVEHALRRRLINAGAVVTRLGFDTSTEVSDAIDRAEQVVFRIGDERRDTVAEHIAPIVRETWSILEQRLHDRRLVHGVPTNFPHLDNLTQGLQAGELIILAARPAVGKTSFALNIARNAAVAARRPVVFFSLEMSKQALVQRLICYEAKVDSYLLRTGQADSTAFQRIAGAMDRLTQAEIWIDDTPGLSISSLRARARRLKTMQGIELIVVDYLQMMQGGRQESRVQEVSDISSGLKSIAKELNVPVLALSQLSRESERRENKRPQLSDLRDSGCLAGSTPVFLPATGDVAPIETLVGTSGFPILALDTERWRLQQLPARSVFCTGVKEVFELRTQMGKCIRATANHPFLTVDGWRRLDELSTTVHVAVPRGLRTPTEPAITDAAAAPVPHHTAERTAAHAAVAAPDVDWDRVVAVTPCGTEPVYDVEVDGAAHNFVAADIVVHNSIEQDADVVLFLYREGMHKPDVDKSKTELIVAKNRNGPVADIDLHYTPEQTAFREPHLRDE